MGLSVKYGIEILHFIDFKYMYHIPVTWNLK